jgi:hypothetical protein
MGRITCAAASFGGLCVVAFEARLATVPLRLRFWNEKSGPHANWLLFGFCLLLVALVGLAGYLWVGLWGSVSETLSLNFSG